MRIIARNTLQAFWTKEPLAEEPLRAWYDEAMKATWKNPNELKRQFGNASIVSTKRVVFNIGGNHFRLIVDIEYRLKIIFVVWVGRHGDYDKLDVRKVAYVKTN
ncbi:MAG TPA: type II toxin-antitoxin system HigB family toxin [Candidatus Kapabacteria bacterium]|nr:type II toxin-antitoxin system HigB family toxin [Candidatus Kapabacteria bacterium]